MATPAEIHREMANAWNKRDFERLESLMHPGYTFTGGDGKEMSGPSAGIAVARMFANAFPDGTLTVQKVYAQGNTAIAEMIGRGTHGGDLMGVAATGRHVEIIICNVMELRDGKVYREREYMDMLAMMTQLGVMRAPGQAAGSA
jgi:steroid delta-isomerase-like uncharacterized protein